MQPLVARLRDPTRETQHLFALGGDRVERSASQALIDYIGYHYGPGVQQRLNALTPDTRLGTVALVGCDEAGILGNIAVQDRESEPLSLSLLDRRSVVCRLQ